MHAATCIACMNANGQHHRSSHMDDVMLNRERLFNRQPSKLFNVHIGMCSLIFVAITAVLFIIDLHK